MPDAPYRDQLPTIELTLPITPKLSVRYELTGDTLTSEHPDAADRGRKTLALADVRRVQLATLGGSTYCSVRAADRRIELSSGFEPLPRGSELERAYHALLEAVNERVAAASPAAEFIAGSWTVVGGFAIMVAIGVAVVAWMSTSGLRDTWQFTAGEIGAALLVLVVLPLTILRARPRPYDPRRIPRIYDPMPQRRPER